MPTQGITGVSGNDILNVNGTIITGHADGDAFKLEPQGDISEYKVSKDGNSIVALKNTGILCKLTIRLVRGCADDIALNGLLAQWRGSPNTFALMPAEYIKATGDGNGNTVNEVYVLNGGTFKIIPGGHTSMDGSVDASVVVYELWFRNDARLLT
jgi:hypothetical protein